MQRFYANCHMMSPIAGHPGWRRGELLPKEYVDTWSKGAIDSLLARGKIRQVAPPPMPRLEEMQSQTSEGRPLSHFAVDPRDLQGLDVPTLQMRLKDAYIRAGRGAAPDTTDREELVALLSADWSE